MTVLYYPPTQNGLQKELDSQLDQGETAAMTLNNVTGVQNKPGVVVLNRIDSGGTEKTASEREFVSFTGTSGNTLTGLTRGLAGSTDQDHAVGSIVEFIFDITQAQAMIDAFNRLVDESDLSAQINDANDNELLSFIETASAVNEITVKNNTTGSPPEIQATGDDTNIDLHIVPKGTGKVAILNASGLEIAEFHNVASAVNYIKLLASATGNAVEISAQGDDTNIDLKISPKGTGDIDANSSVIKNVTDPSNAQDAATKNYVDTNAAPTDGWTDPSETWSYASASSFTISGVNVTSKYQKGTKIKMTQSTGGTKYFVVKSSSFSTNTTVNIVEHDGATIANEAISDNFYSYQSSPQGFPSVFLFTTTYTGFSSDPSGKVEYTIDNGFMFGTLYTGGGTSNSGSFNFTVPIAPNYDTANFRAFPCAVQNAGSWQAGNGVVGFSNNSTTAKVGLDGSTISANAYGGFTSSGAKAGIIVWSYPI